MTSDEHSSYEHSDESEDDHAVTPGDRLAPAPGGSIAPPSDGALSIRALRVKEETSSSLLRSGAAPMRTGAALLKIGAAPMSRFRRNGAAPTRVFMSCGRRGLSSTDSGMS